MEPSHVYQIIIGFLFIALVAIIISSSQNNSEDSNLFLTLMTADSEYRQVSLDSQIAESYYLEAVSSYENGDYKLSETKSKMAREYYIKVNQGCNMLKMKLDAVDIDDELINTYKETLDLKITIANNIIEVCEHFEDASGYYNEYFNTNVSVDDVTYTNGDKSIALMNAKIKERDDNVVLYNNKLIEYEAQLENKLRESKQ